MDQSQRVGLLRERATGYARVALANIAREYPNELRHPLTGPDDRPLPHEIHPSFYGSYDWHSCVEMHWLLVRLLRTIPDLPGGTGAEVRATLDEHLAAEPLAVEARYFTGPEHRTFERPYGWGWALALADEASALAASGDPDAAAWSRHLAPLGLALENRFLHWLPTADYPNRHGMHTNTAFGMSLALGYARRRAAEGHRGLLDAIAGAARRWYARDADYPGGWEPSGSDFLSPALVEAELLASLLEPAAFAAWFDRFLPGVADGVPAALFTPASVSDDTDGQIAHLHGLNLSRAWCWQRLADTLARTDDRVPVMRDAARRHAAAGLDHATGGDYMVEHWLAAYAVLLLSC